MPPRGITQTRRLRPLALAAALGLMPATAPALGADEHSGMFRTGPTRTMPVYDPRFVNRELAYSLIDGQYVVVDGDLELGKEMDVLKRSWGLAVETAKVAVSSRDRTGALIIDTIEFQGGEKNSIIGFAKNDPRAFPAQSIEEGKDLIAYAQRVLDPLLSQRTPDAPDRRNKEHASVIFAGASREFLWPDGKIPYVMGEDVPDEAMVLDAMKHWTDKTKGRITFVPRDQDREDYVRFKKGTGCSSQWVGKRGGEQTVTLSSHCGSPQLIHELGHVIGLFHEQNRLDRGQHIEVIEDHMAAGAAAQFNRSPVLNEDTARDEGPFDWKSIMLYPPKAYSEDDQQTLVRLDKRDDIGWGIDSGPKYGGVTRELSAGDVRAVMTLYATVAR